jgi:hypothetical protein
MNIIKEDIIPETFGEFIDSLIIANIKMWHAQEMVYEVETLKKLTLESMFRFLKESTWLNLARNQMMEGVDSAMSNRLMDKHPDLIPLEKKEIINVSTPMYEANEVSNSLTYLPLPEIHPVSRQSFTYFFSFPEIEG